MAKRLVMSMLAGVAVDMVLSKVHYGMSWSWYSLWFGECR